MENKYEYLEKESKEELIERVIRIDKELTKIAGYFNSFRNDMEDVLNDKIRDNEKKVVSNLNPITHIELLSAIKTLKDIREFFAFLNERLWKERYREDPASCSIDSCECEEDPL